MSKFIFLYKGNPTPMDQMTPEEGQAVMEKWGIWAGKVGAGLVDMGTPFGPGASIVDDGTAGTAAPLNGYSIVEADSLDAAKGLTDGHPFLDEGKGDFAIDVFELMPVPGM